MLLPSRLPRRSLPTLALLAFALPATSSAQQRKLNGPLAQANLTQVSSFTLASGLVSYLTSFRELCVVPLDGSRPVSEIFQSTLGADGGIVSQKLTPDGTRIVLTGSLAQHGTSELFTLPADGSGPPVRLHPALAQFSGVTAFQISADSRRVVYEQDGSGASADGLFSVPIDGSAPPVALNGAFYSSKYQITPDSAHVLFSDGHRLFTVPIEGGVAPLRVHGPLGGMREVRQWDIAPDGRAVVYLLNYDDWMVYELYSAPVDGSAPQVKLNGPLVEGGSVTRFQISPYSTHVTYTADEVVDGTEGLYAVPIQGGPIVEISPGVAGRMFFEQAISPDRHRMVYLANHGVLYDYELYSVPLDHSQPPVKLSGTISGQVLPGFLVGGESVVFRVVRPDQATELYRAPLDGSTPPVLLGPPLAATHGVPNGGFQIAAGRVVFLADPGALQAYELYSAPLDGSAPAIRLHPPLVAGGGVKSFVLDSTGTLALYRAEQDIAELIELFVVPVDGSAAPVARSDNRLHLTTVADVSVPTLTSDGASAVFIISDSFHSSVELYDVNLEGEAQPVRLDASQLDSFLVTPDSRRAVYRRGNEFRSVLLDGSAPSARTCVFPGLLSGLVVTPDSSRLICRSTSGVYDDPPKRLFSAPVDGSAPPVELNLPRAVDGGVSTWQVSPDSTRVVYTGVQAVAGRTELFSAPVSGGAAPLRLSDPLVDGGHVGPPKISADSSRVVYLASRVADDFFFELFSVSLAGGAAPVELSALPSSDRDVQLFEISPDSTHVVYIADQDAFRVDDLYSVPLAGGVPIAVRPLGSGTSVSSFLISPDSRWVVYSVVIVGGKQRLYSVPLAGGATPVLLSLPSDYSNPVAISADSRTVVFGKRRPDYATDLFSVPIAGGSVPVQLNESSPVEYGVSIDSSSRWFLYSSAPHDPAQRELFIAPLHGEGPSRSVAGVLPDDSTVYGLFRPGASSVVFRADKDEAGAYELYIDERLTEPAGHARRR